MTTLLITPNPDRKTARFKGTIAAGEHVSVTVKDGAEWNEEGLTLRVIDFTTMRTLAVFPRPAEVLEDGEEPDAWGTTQSGDLTCTLNLNTVRMVNAARHMIHVPVLFVLGNSDEDSRTLYFRDRYEVELWPERIGDDVPYDLDKWPKQIDEWTDQMDEWARQMQTFGEALTAEAEARASGDAPLSGQVINTNTTNALRQAVKTIGAALGATMRVLAVCAALPLLGASVRTAPLGDLDLDQNPSVVTNVTFEGLLTEHQDISEQADKTNTYTTAEADARIGELAAPAGITASDIPCTNSAGAGTVQSVFDAFRNGYNANIPYFLQGHTSSAEEKRWDSLLYGAGHTFDWRVNSNYDVGFNWILVDDIILKGFSDGGDHSLTNALLRLGNSTSPDAVTRQELSMFASTGTVYKATDAEGAATAMNLHSSDKLYNVADLKTESTNAAVAVVRELSLGGIYDNKLGVWWTPHMSDGAYYWTATTNVNLNAGN